MCETILSAILGCGDLDAEFLAKKVKCWNLDIDEIVEVLRDYEGMAINYDNLMYAIFREHTLDVKDYIEDLLYNNDISFDVEKLQYYEPQVYVNYMDSGYDDNYEFWEYSIEELKCMLSDITKFLIEENIIENETTFTLKEKLNNI
jgi:hypothetical protein